MRVWRIHPLACVIFSVALLLSGCMNNPGLPSAARMALQREWGELGLALDAGKHIQRAWKGDLGRVSGEINMPKMELWCVEVQNDLQLASSVEGNNTIWIVVKPEEGSDWSASILMTMSSLWAYEACGVIE